jgi:sulfate adenylyltransferase subunit 2
MQFLERQANLSVEMIREAFERYDRPVVLWSMGKDSTLLLWLCRKAFLGQVPFPVVHIDTGRKMAEMYAFRDRLAEEWGLDLRVFRNEEALREGVDHDDGALECCHKLKTLALLNALKDLGADAALVGIRRDEHGVRAKERYFSPRDESGIWEAMDQPPELWDQPLPEIESAHDRVHPLLHLTERDVWLLTQAEGIPVNPLYFAREGWRFRSLGCEPCCMPVPSDAANVDEIVAELACVNAPERSGRLQDKEAEFSMQKLRSLGYM